MRGAFALQLRLTRSDPDYYMPLVVAPVLAVVFLAIVLERGRPDLVPYALVTPVLIALWHLALLNGGEIIDADRDYGVLEPELATPASFAIVALARAAAVSSIATLAWAEVFAVARFVFDAPVRIHHPTAFAVTIALTAGAMTGVSLIMAAVFAAARSARAFQNALTFPFYLLGGVMAPVDALPHWLRPFSGVVFLSWSADLLRDSLRPADLTELAYRWAALAALSVAGAVVGSFAIARVLHSLRRTGRLGFS